MNFEQPNFEIPPKENKETPAEKRLPSEGKPENKKGAAIDNIYNTEMRREIKSYFGLEGNFKRKLAEIASTGGEGARQRLNELGSEINRILEDVSAAIRTARRELQNEPDALLNPHHPKNKAVSRLESQTRELERMRLLIGAKLKEVS